MGLSLPLVGAQASFRGSMTYIWRAIKWPSAIGGLLRGPHGPKRHDVGSNNRELWAGSQSSQSRGAPAAPTGALKKGDCDWPVSAGA